MNREHEEEAAARAGAVTGPATPFERVVELIGGPADSAEDGARGLEVMRSLLVRLKNDPKRRVAPPPAPAASEPLAAAAAEPRAAGPGDDPFSGM